MGNLKAGFSRINVTPPLGIGVMGYFKPRLAEKILDDLEITTLALASGEEKVLLISFDICLIPEAIVKRFQKAIVDATGVSEDAVFIHATHTHNGPFLEREDDGFNFLDVNVKENPEEEYCNWVCRKMADAAKMALEDLKPARMGWGIGHAPGISFVRRYRMKDGSIRTNPGVNNPEILEPVGTVDERVNVLRFDREGAESLVLVNFGTHPDTVGGNGITADWPGFVRRTVEKTIDHTKCIFFNGMQGDVNHVNVFPTGGFLNDTQVDFDDVSRGYGHARYMGRVVAGGVLQVYDKVKYIEADNVRFLSRTIQIPSNMPKAEEMEEAYRIDRLHRMGKDEELPFSGMMLTTVVADAARKIRLEHGPKFFEMKLYGVAVGDVVIVGIPAEPFTGVGLALKDTKDWEVVLPMCLVNGSLGYLPMRDAYEEGGYEAADSFFAPGVAEQVIQEGRILMEALK